MVADERWNPLVETYDEWLERQSGNAIRAIFQPPVSELSTYTGLGPVYGPRAGATFPSQTAAPRPAPVIAPAGPSMPVGALPPQVPTRTVAPKVVVDTSGTFRGVTTPNPWIPRPATPTSVPATVRPTPAANPWIPKPVAPTSVPPRVTAPTTSGSPQVVKGPDGRWIVPELRDQTGGYDVFADLSPQAQNAVLAGYERAAAGEPVDTSNQVNLLEALFGIIDQQNQAAASSAAAARAQQEAERQQVLQMLASREGSLRGLQSEQDARLNQILSDLTSRATAARGEVAGAYGAGSQSLQQLADEYAQMQAARQQAAANTLRAFGADPNVVDRGYNPLDTIAAQRAMLSGSQAATDAMLADRANVYNALVGDVRTRDAQAYRILMDQIAAERAALGG